MKGSEQKFRKSDVCGCGYDGITECDCGGELVICEGYDVYNNEFNYVWECEDCGRTISISGTIVKAQKLNEATDTWEDIDRSIAEDFRGSIDQIVDYDEELKSVVYKLYDDEGTIRYIISDVVFEDTQEDEDEDEDE